MALSTPQVTSWVANTGSENEDRTAVSLRTAVVVDGAGLPRSLRTGCSHSVAWYAQTLATAFHDCLLESGASMRDALGQAITDVTSQHQDSCDLAAGSPSAAVAGWRITKTHLEYLVLCDCSVLLCHETGSCEEITDRRLDELVEPQVPPRAQAPAEDETDPARGVLAARRIAVEAGRNIPGGFWCCQNEPEAAQHALTGERVLSNLRGAVLATDGATRGLHLLRGTHDLRGLVTRALDGAHANVLREIRAAEREARTVLSARAVKVHDDATLVGLRVR